MAVAPAAPAVTPAILKLAGQKAGEALLAALGGMLFDELFGSRFAERKLNEITKKLDAVIRMLQAMPGIIEDILKEQLILDRLAQVPALVSDLHASTVELEDIVANRESYSVERFDEACNEVRQKSDDCIRLAMELAGRSQLTYLGVLTLLYPAIKGYGILVPDLAAYKALRLRLGDCANVMRPWVDPTVVNSLAYAKAHLDRQYAWAETVIPRLQQGRKIVFALSWMKANRYLPDLDPFDGWPGPLYPGEPYVLVYGCYFEIRPDGSLNGDEPIVQEIELEPNEDFKFSALDPRLKMEVPAWVDVKNVGRNFDDYQIAADGLAVLKDVHATYAETNKVLADAVDKVTKLLAACDEATSVPLE